MLVFVPRPAVALCRISRCCGVLLCDVCSAQILLMLGLMACGLVVLDQHIYPQLASIGQHSVSVVRVRVFGSRCFLRHCCSCSCSCGVVTAPVTADTPTAVSTVSSLENHCALLTMRPSDRVVADHPLHRHLDHRVLHPLRVRVERHRGAVVLRRPRVLPGLVEQHHLRRVRAQGVSQRRWRSLPARAARAVVAALLRCSVRR